MAYGRHLFAGILFLAMSCLTWAADEIAQPSKIPVPDDAAQAAALKLVTEIYKDEYSKAKTSRQRSELVSAILSKSAETGSDPAGRFVLLRVGRDMAVQASDVDGALNAVEQMAGVFTIDELAMKADVLARISGSLREPREAASAAEQCLDASEEAVAADRYDLAHGLNRTAASLGRIARDADLLKRIQLWSREVADFDEAHNAAQQAAAVLAKDPVNPEANLTAGRYQCFYRGDWEKGLPMLALGSDPVLKKLATADLKGAPELAQQLELGDGWWTVRQDNAGVRRRNVQQQAVAWYLKALPQLAGLSKEKVEKRLKEVSPELLTKQDVPMEVEPPTEPVVDEPKGDKPSRDKPSRDKGPKKKSRPQINVVSARWGLPGGWADVTARARKAVDGHSWVWATTDFLHKDPVPHKTKRLEITYELNGQRKTDTVWERNAWKRATGK